MFINYHNTKCCKQKRIKSVFGVNINSQEKTSADQFITSINPRRVKNFFILLLLTNTWSTFQLRKNLKKKRKEKKKVLLVKAPAVTFLHPGLVFLNTPGFVPLLEKWLVGFRPNAQITSDQDSLDYQRVSVAFSFCLATAFWTSTEKLDSTWKHLSAAKFQLVKDFNDSGCPLWIPILIQIFSWS